MKIKIPFLSSPSESADALSKIEAALTATDAAQVRGRQLHADLVAANELADTLKPAIQRAHERCILARERMERETDREGIAPADLAEALAVAEQDYAELVEQRDQVAAEAARLHQAIRDHQRSPPVTVEICAQNVVAVQAMLAETLTALEKVGSAITRETARLSQSTVDESEVVSARRALEDLLADALDEADQVTEISAAQARLKEAEARYAADQARFNADMETVQRTIAGLERKRETLEGEQARRVRWVAEAKRLLLETEIGRATAEYAQAAEAVFQRLRELAALGFIAQRAVCNGQPYAARCQNLKAAAPRGRSANLKSKSPRNRPGNGSRVKAS